MEERVGIASMMECKFLYIFPNRKLNLFFFFCLLIGPIFPYAMILDLQTLSTSLGKCLDIIFCSFVRCFFFSFFFSHQNFYHVRVTVYATAANVCICRNIELTQMYMFVLRNTRARTRSFGMRV